MLSQRRAMISSSPFRLDRTAAPRDRRRDERILPTISVFYGIVIRMFFREHEPSHFHAEYGELSVVISIETLEILAGSLPRRTLALVLEWAALHREELRADWGQCRRHEQPTRIAPLE